jgi:aromatic ring-opening dioxygenase catalytic subunit (LigB family)
VADNQTSTPTATVMPVVFVPHGGGPMPLLGEPNHRELIAFLQNLGQQLPRPRAILMISAHWEESIASVSSSPSPAMIYDYQGFPPESYEFQYPAAGDPILAQEIVDRLAGAGIPARLDPERGYDHGTFVPLMLMYPAADIPVVQLSLLRSLDPKAQIDLGKAIAPLREQNVLIVGSGMSFHNMRAFFSDHPDTPPRSEAFDEWLTDTLTSAGLTDVARQARLENWQAAPHGRFSHPREEHLLPLYVCFGAASHVDTRAEKIFSGTFFGTHIAGFIWG